MTTELLSYKTMKRKIFGTTILMTSLCLGTPLRAENPEHVRQLLKTKSCQECDLSGANLSGLDLSSAMLVGADLRGANLTRANLSNANLTRANLTQANFSQANLSQAYLTNANLDRTNLLGALLTGTKGVPLINSPLAEVALPSLRPFPPLPQAPDLANSRPSIKPLPVLPTAPLSPSPKPIPSVPNTAAVNPFALPNNVSQVSEVRNYFQQRWQPPQGLTQNLEYILWLNADGSIQRIIPLGKVAADYLGRVNIPSLGERFVSPLQGELKPKIRLVLIPNGQVQTFLEKD
jgi:hypothetical protein